MVTLYTWAPGIHLKKNGQNVLSICVKKPSILFFIHRVEPTQLAFVILGASMAALALMILVTAILATGATRVEVYKSSVGRVGGRVASACFIFKTYILLLAWLVALVCCIIVTMAYTLSWGRCRLPSTQLSSHCVDNF